MKNRRFRTIMISGYLSAMLATNIPPVSSDVALAGAIDSAAARRALESAVAGLNAQGWAPSVTAHADVPSPPAALVSISAPQVSDPVISEELMARLIKRTLASSKDTWIHPQVGAIFGLSDGVAKLPVKQLLRTEPDGKHYIAVRLEEGAKDVFVAFTSPSGDVVNFYLTDKSGNLRAAATSGFNLANLRLITNEQAAEKYKAEMSLMGKLAEKLPPTGAAVAGNS